MNNYISKLLENVGELTYTEPDDSEKNLFEVTGVRSVLGEHLLFKQVNKLINQSGVSFKVEDWWSVLPVELA